MSYNIHAILDKAIEITKEYAGSGSSTPVEIVLRKVYEELKKINSEIGE